MAEDRIAHLGMIQSVIDRMARNTFVLRGWTVTLVAAILALAAQGTGRHFAVIAFMPAFMFWALDGYYLYQERLFRALYQKVATSTEDTDFSMNTSIFRGDGGQTWCREAFSVTSGIFYGVVVLIIVVSLFLLPSAQDLNKPNNEDMETTAVRGELHEAVACLKSIAMELADTDPTDGGHDDKLKDRFRNETPGYQE